MSNEINSEFFMTIDDVFNIIGRGVIALGLIKKGTIKQGDVVEILDQNNNSNQAKVASIEMFRKIKDSATEGDNVGILLSGIDKSKISKGMVLIKNRIEDKIVNSDKYAMQINGLKIVTEQISEMSNEQIKNYYLEIGKKDKFTKNQKVTSKQRITLLDINFEKVIDLGISYFNVNSEDAIVFELNYTIRDKILAKEFSWDMGNLKNATLLFLLDDNETIKIDKVLEYIPNDYMMNQFVGRYKENLFLITDVATLIKLASAKKIEYRLTGNGLGDSCEGELNYEESLKFKGFYNGVFDPEFSTEELMKYAEEGIIREEEIKRRIEEDIKKMKEEEQKEKEAEAQKVKPASSESSSSCFVITATMGDLYHPIVDEFRAYRDRKLLTNEFGKAFVSFYYKVGPYAASIISKSEILRKLSFSFFVNPIYKRLKNDRNTNKN